MRRAIRRDGESKTFSILTPAVCQHLPPLAPPVEEHNEGTCKIFGVDHGAPTF
jgi:hypothetical protein